MVANERWHLRRILKDPELKAERLARIEELEDEVFEKACGILNGALDFYQVTHDQKEPPPEWVAEYGQEGAKQRLAVAKAGWLPQSVAPNAFKLAAQVRIGVLKGRQWNHQQVTQNLNVKLVLPTPTTAEHPGPTTYETRELET